MKIQNIIIVMILFLTMGTPSQAATISGSSERHFKGECGDLIKITYTSDNPIHFSQLQLSMFQLLAQEQLSLKI